jgi:hypothetical protein
MLFSTWAVSSQTEENRQNRNVPDKTKQDMMDNSVRELIELLTEDSKETPAGRKVKAIEHLGASGEKKGIPVLIKLLDYKNESLPVIDPKAINIMMDEPSPAGRYPAIGALMQIGKPALPALVEVVEKEEPGTLRSENAITTIRYIFLRGNLLDGVIFLEKSASESKSPKGSDRLFLLAQELRVLMKKLQQ